MNSGTLKASVFVLLTFLVFSHVAPAAAQEGGSITGVVVDGETGEPLIGANAVLPGGTTGGTTDIDGRYAITGLEIGRYDVTFSYVGYQSKTVQGVEVVAGEAAQLDVSLAPEAVDLEEVTVTAEVARNSEAALLRDRQRAAAVSDAIGAEAISQSGSSDAADAMEKVTGASVTDGKYVSVRGLGGRYINTTLNGAELPSSDPDQNAVPFDLFPSSLLENIVTSKTFTPDRSGSFTGGSIDIGTVAFPQNMELTVSSSLGYNSTIGYGDHLGFAGGLNEVPDVASGGVPNYQIGLDPAAASQLDAVTTEFGTALVPVSSTLPVDQSYELTFGNKFDVLGDRPFGVVSSFSYDQDVSGYSNGVSARYPLASTGDQGLTRNLDLADQSSTVEDLYGGVANFSFRPFTKHEVGVNFLYTRSEQREGRFQSGFSREFGGDSDSEFQTRTLRKTIRDVRTVQARGEHTFGGGLAGGLFGQGLRFEWNGALTRTTQEEPDYRFFATQFFPDESRYGPFNTLFDPPTRFFRNLSEDGVSADASLNVPLAFLDFKVGGSYADKSRDFRQRRFFYRSGDVRTSYDGNPEQYFGTEAGLVNGGNDLGTIIQEDPSRANSYDGAQTVTAGFAMIDTPIPGLRKLRLVGGVRVERTDLSTVTLADSPERGRIEETDLLPSANLVYAVTDAMNVRAAYGRTLARPSFKEFAPAQFFDFIGAYPELGNPELERTLVDNFDLRWEWFVRPGELLAVSGFYKDFSNAIERVFVSNSANPVITYFNSDNAKVYGAEFEIRKQLGFLGAPLKDLSAGGNLTLTQSEVAIPEASRDVSGEASRPLQGQSPFLVNVDLNYENPDIGTSIGVFYNIFGERLAEITRDAGPDRYEQPRHVVDLTASQRMGVVGLPGLRVKFKAQNLLDENYEVTRQFGGESYVVRRYELGRSFTFGLEYSL